MEGGPRLGAEGERGSWPEFWSLRLAVVLRSPPWLRAILGLSFEDRSEESGFGASCSLSWAEFLISSGGAYSTVPFKLLCDLEKNVYSGLCHSCEMALIFLY